MSEDQSKKRLRFPYRIDEENEMEGGKMCEWRHMGFSTKGHKRNQFSEENMSLPFRFPSHLTVFVLASRTRLSFPTPKIGTEELIIKASARLKVGVQKVSVRYDEGKIEKKCIDSHVEKGNK